METKVTRLKNQFEQDITAPVKDTLLNLNNNTTITENPEKFREINQKLQNINTNIQELNQDLKKGITGTRHGFKAVIFGSAVSVFTFCVDAVVWAVTETYYSMKKPKHSLEIAKWCVGGLGVGLLLATTVVGIIYTFKKRQRKNLKKKIDTDNYIKLLGSMSEFVQAIDLLKNATQTLNIDEYLKNCIKKYDELDPNIKKQIPPKSRWIPFIIEQLPDNDQLKVGLTRLKKIHSPQTQPENDRETIIDLDELEEKKIELNNENDKEDKDDKSNDEKIENNISHQFYTTTINLDPSSSSTNSSPTGSEGEIQYSTENWQKKFLKQNIKPKYNLSGERGDHFSLKEHIEEDSPLLESADDLLQLLEKRTGTIVDEIDIGNQTLSKTQKIKMGFETVKMEFNKIDEN